MNILNLQDHKIILKCLCNFLLSFYAILTANRTTKIKGFLKTFPVCCIFDKCYIRLHMKITSFL